MGSAQVGVAAPDLVVVSPGVQVIADYDEPIFFSDNYYWRNTDGAWYRSTSYSGGWGRVEVAPVAIRSIERPAAYVHYHGEARVTTPARAPEVRDHREGEVRANAMPGQPEVRDHREDEHKEAPMGMRKEEPKEAPRDVRKDERKDDRKDDKHGRK